MKAALLEPQRMWSNFDRRYARASCEKDKFKLERHDSELASELKSKLVNRTFMQQRCDDKRVKIGLHANTFKMKRKVEFKPVQYFWAHLLEKPVQYFWAPMPSKVVES